MALPFTSDVISAATRHSKVKKTKHTILWMCIICILEIMMISLQIIRILKLHLTSDNTNKINNTNPNPKSQTTNTI